MADAPPPPPPETSLETVSPAATSESDAPSASDLGSDASTDPAATGDRSDVSAPGAPDTSSTGSDTASDSAAGVSSDAPGTPEPATDSAHDTANTAEGGDLTSTQTEQNDSGDGQLDEATGESQIVEIIPSNEAGKPGQPGHFREHLVIAERPDGTQTVARGGWGTSAEGHTEVLVQKESPMPAAADGPGDGLSHADAPPGGNGPGGDSPPEPAAESAGTTSAGLEIVSVESLPLASAEPEDPASNQAEAVSGTTAEDHGPVSSETPADDRSNEQASTEQAGTAEGSSTADSPDPPASEGDPPGRGGTAPETNMSVEANASVEANGSYAEAPGGQGDQQSQAGDRGTEQVGDPPDTGQEGIGSFVEGLLLGDFAENQTWSGVAGQTVGGFIPVWGQVADARDIAHAVGDVIEGKDGAWADLGINVVAIVPGLDALKGFGKVGKRASGIRTAGRHADTVHAGPKHGDQVTDPGTHTDRTGTSNQLSEVDQEVERAFSETADYRQGRSASYQPSRDPALRPDLSGDRSAQRLSGEAAKGIHRVMTQNIGAHGGLRQAWESARADVLARYPGRFPSNAADMNRTGGAFDKTRVAFWKNVHDNPSLKSFFEKNGFTFDKPGRAPVHSSFTKEFADSPAKLIDEFRVSIDHTLPKAKGENWQQALDPDHLQFVTQAENRYLQLLETKGVSR